MIGNFSPGTEDFVSPFRELLRELWSQVRVIFPSRQRGHPEVAIMEEQLKFLVENKFKTKHIAELFGCSKRTIKCRINAFNIHHNYATITDIELDALVENISSIYARCGEKVLIGRFRGRGVIVQRHRIRESLH